MDVLGPAVADSLDVKTFAEHADLAPRVPVGRHEDLIAVDDVVAEGFALYEGCYAEAGVDEGSEGGGEVGGCVDEGCAVWE